ncbi:Hypothetical protein BIBO2_0008 [Brucella sp. BO2]|nr:Hypothetical protein BIBO2_0008 [Brucella sp. BO2]
MERNRFALLTRKCSRTVPVLTESPEPLYLFGFTHYPTQNCFALLLEML